jgi:hypothetical protein
MPATGFVSLTPKLEEKIGEQWYWQLLASMHSISESCWRLSQKKNRLKANHPYMGHEVS